MKPSSPVRVVLTGGGTGGHVYPALALHEILARAGIVGETLYLGIRGRAEETIVPRRGLALHFVPSAPVAGTGTLGKLRAFLTIARGIVVALRELLVFRPHLVVASGGYASAPVVAAAFLLRPFLRLKIVLDEQNLAPGLLNKVASLLADVVLVAFRETPYFVWSTRCVYTGYPVRAAYRASDGQEDRAALRRRLGVPDGAHLVVVSGGSLGSRSLNRAVAESLAGLSDLPDLLVVHGVGLAKGSAYDALGDTKTRLAAALGDRFDDVDLTARSADGRVFYRAAEYFHDFADWQRAADLLVGRAGAGSLAETLALGQAMIAVPKRGLPGDHQELNAVGLAERGAVEVLFERRADDGTDSVDAGELVAAIRGLLADPTRRAALAATAHSLAFAGTETAVLDVVRKLLGGEEPAYETEVIEPAFVRFQRQFDSLVAHLDVTAPGLYHRLYDTKVDEYLGASDEMVVNKGIKLVGALGRIDRYRDLVAGLERWRGFLRRNALAALRKAASPQPCFATAAARGLADGYWEVRREALALIERFPAELGTIELLRDGVARLAARRREGFEVRGGAIRAAALVLDEGRFLALVEPLLAARSVRLREAALDAIAAGLEAGRLVDRAAARRLLERAVVTTSEFAPAFRIRERYLAAARALEGHRK